MKRCIIGAFYFLMFFFTVYNSFSKEICEGLQNGDFEEAANENVAHWQPPPSIRAVRKITWDAENSTDGGSKSIAIENILPNDTYWTQIVTGLKPKTPYLLSGKLKGENIEGNPDKTGAAIFVRAETEIHTPWQIGTFDWKSVSIAFVAPEKGTVIIQCRLGSTQETAGGKVWFDNISLTPYTLRCSPHPPPFDGNDPVCQSKIYGSDIYPAGAWIYLWPQQGPAWVGYRIDKYAKQRQYDAPWLIYFARRESFLVEYEVMLEHGAKFQFDPLTITIADAYYIDEDNDGYGQREKKRYALGPLTGYVLNSQDCNDERIDINPNGEEVCNGLDDNCDGKIDEDLLETFYIDADGDGYGSPYVTIEACQAPEGYTDNQWDCDDDNPSVHPFAMERCNASDDDCDLFIDESCT